MDSAGYTYDPWYGGGPVHSPLVSLTNVSSIPWASSSRPWLRRHPLTRAIQSISLHLSYSLSLSFLLCSRGGPRSTDYNLVETGHPLSTRREHSITNGRTSLLRSYVYTYSVDGVRVLGVWKKVTPEAVAMYIDGI